MRRGRWPSMSGTSSAEMRFNEALELMSQERLPGRLPAGIMVSDCAFVSGLKAIVFPKYQNSTGGINNSTNSPPIQGWWERIMGVGALCQVGGKRRRPPGELSPRVRREEINFIRIQSRHLSERQELAKKKNSRNHECWG
ncbi:hypothetical protein CEXT_579271 [Caerostris extrusa]|uniref:Uncharacterized protein n=1 Tax=Caerostris extrusa TaxID=172846 RepID=A0AAV4XEV4_CAEEX|nr:hypothetical protein CEXT_579271 [Caerostris extrusa]